MNTETFDLSAFAAANPDRPILLLLPAVSAPEVTPIDLVEALEEAEFERVPTLLYGEARRDEEGDLSVKIRFPRDLDLQEICFAGTTRGEVVRVQCVFVADRPVFAEGEGVPVGHFEAGPLARVLKGWRGPAGLELLVHAHATGPARLCVSVVAHKRLRR